MFSEHSFIEIYEARKIFYQAFTKLLPRPVEHNAVVRLELPVAQNVSAKLNILWRKYDFIKISETQEIMNKALAKLLVLPEHADVPSCS